MAPSPRSRYGLVFLFVAIFLSLPVIGQSPSTKPSFPWMNTKLSPDERAALVVKEMTLDEKITLLHGTGHPGLGPMSPLSSGSNGGRADVGGVSRLRDTWNRRCYSSYG